MLKKRLVSRFLIFLSFIALPPLPLSFAGVTVSDAVTSVGTPVRIEVRTRGALFPQGGVSVSFYLERESLGRTLTGGDGYGFFTYRPEKSGLLRLEAYGRSGRGEGFLLSVRPDETVVLIEIEGGLLENIFLPKPRDGSAAAVKEVSEKSRIVYLSGAMGEGNARKWLDAAGFPESPVLRQGGRPLIEDLQERKVTLRAVIGSPDFIKETEGLVTDRYTFGETPAGRSVESWEKIPELLSPK